METLYQIRTTQLIELTILEVNQDLTQLKDSTRITLLMNLFESVNPLESLRELN